MHFGCGGLASKCFSVLRIMRSFVVLYLLSPVTIKPFRWILMLSWRAYHSYGGMWPTTNLQYHPSWHYYVNTSCRMHPFLRVLAAPASLSFRNFFVWIAKRLRLLQFILKMISSWSFFCFQGLRSWYQLQKSSHYQIEQLGAGLVCLLRPLLRSLVQPFCHYCVQWLLDAALDRHYGSGLNSRRNSHLGVETRTKMKFAMEAFGQFLMKSQAAAWQEEPNGSLDLDSPRYGFGPAPRLNYNQTHH